MHLQFYIQFGESNKKVEKDFHENKMFDRE